MNPKYITFEFLKSPPTTTTIVGAPAFKSVKIFLLDFINYKSFPPSFMFIVLLLHVLASSKNVQNIHALLLL